MSTKAKVAGEIVAHCRKCGLDLAHTVVAMVGETPKRVLCKTCKQEHAYHRPLEERGAPSRTSSERVSKSSGSSHKSAKAMLDMENEAVRERAWRDRIAGQPASAFSLYSPRGTFKAEQLLRHTKFGDGFVSHVIDAGKIEVVFRDGPRTLAHGLSG